MSSALVWFKRDLRLQDHAAVHAAGRLAPGQPLRGVYIVEPGLWSQPDAAAQHLAFVHECLQDLAAHVAATGGELLIRQGEAVEVLAALHAEAPFATLLAHEETGNAFTYARDLAVAAWCRQQGVSFQEWPQFGVVRRLADRDDWQRRWQAHMRQATWPGPQAIDRLRRPMSSVHLSWPDPVSLGLSPQEPRTRQQGGRTRALAVLDDFLLDRCARYRGGISSPLSAPSACSRLSPYLAHGCLSMREVVQATAARMADLRHALSEPALSQTEQATATRQLAGLRAFLSRLHWHCHFIQKLESEPELEWRNLHRGYDGLREGEFNPAHFEALQQGRTGWPLVDACVAMLRETGWVNFRMRAMLVSVASYPLWLHWRPVGEWLARQFLDYEPGIHWSQLQMQAGTTGINTTRVYNPIKQARDQDPHGHFVRRWLPAMRRVPDAWLFEPWLMPEELQARCGVRVGGDPHADIPRPLVDLAEALRTSKARMHALRAQPEVKAATGDIVRKHGSRTFRDGQRARSSAAKRPADALPPDHPQLTLGF